jgi:predicted MFS family arabinose efflux permease
MITTDSSPARRHLTWPEWGLVAVLALVNFTHILDFVIVMPLGERLMRTMQIDARQFGLVVSAYGLAATASGVLASLVADRFDRRTLLLASYAGFILATLFCGLANTFPLFLLARVLAGVFGGLAASAIMAVIGDVFPDLRRGKAIGAVTSAFAVASVLGLPAGLFLAKAFDSYGVPFVAIAAASVGVWGVAWVRLPSVTGHLAHRSGLSAVAGFVAVVRRPNHQKSFAFMLTLVLGTFTIIPFLAPHMQINCGRSDDDIPWIYAAAGVCTLIGMNVVGWLTDRVGKRPVFLVTAVGAMVMTLVITQLPPVGFWGAAAAATLFMVTAAGRVVPAQGMMLATADPKTRGAFTTLNAAVSHLATGLGPLISGAVITTRTETSDLGVETIVQLDHYDRAGFLAVGFAAIALLLSFLLRQPARSGTPVPEPSTAS